MPPLRPAHRWLNDGPVDAGQLVRRPVLVHFWAQSSPLCREQLPRLAGWRARFGDVAVVSVHTPLAVEDMDDDRVVDAVSAHGVTHPVALDGDDGALADAYQVYRTPAYFLFDDEGQLALYATGPEAMDLVERALERLMPRREDRRREEAGWPHPHPGP
jgi:thiol-disulfide isomerase/thioredoxin